MICYKIKLQTNVIWIQRHNSGFDTVNVIPERNFKAIAMETLQMNLAGSPRCIHCNELR